MPNICRKLTELVANAKNVTASRPAAAETIRPVRASPVRTASTVDAPRWCSSVIRLITNTS